MPTLDASETSQPIPSNKFRGQEEEAPKQTSRPRRKAAQEAARKISASLKKISLRTRFRYGWETDDQEDDDDTTDTWQIPPTDYSTSDDSPTSSSDDAVTHSPRSTVTDNDSVSTTEPEDNDLDWDTSPSQYALISQPDYEPTGMPILTRHRSRILGTSERSLTRSDAFRQPPDPRPDAPKKKSRIPLPTSPRQVELNKVNDVSLAINYVEFKDTRQTNRPRRRENIEEEVHRSTTTRPRRESARRINYRSFHDHGHPGTHDEQEDTGEGEVNHASIGLQSLGERQQPVTANNKRTSALRK